MEEIEYSTDCPALKGTDLDSDVNSNMANADEEEEDDEGHGGGKHRRGSVSQSQPSSIRSLVFPHQIRQASIETLSEKRNTCNAVSIANGQIS